MDIKKRLAKHDTDIQDLIRLAELQQKNLAAFVKEGRELRRMLAELSKKTEAGFAEIRERFRQTDERFKETDERFKETNERIQALVSAMGEFIRRTTLPAPPASKPPSPKRA